MPPFFENEKYRVEIIHYATHIREGNEYPSNDTVITIYDKATGKSQQYVDTKAMDVLYGQIRDLMDEKDATQKLSEEWRHLKDVLADNNEELRAENEVLKAQIKLAEVREKLRKS